MKWSEIKEIAEVLGVYLFYWIVAHPLSIKHFPQPMVHAIDVIATAVAFTSIGILLAQLYRNRQVRP